MAQTLSAMAADKQQHDVRVRAMSHPLYHAKASSQMPPQGEPLDAQDLFRRLERHQQHLERSDLRRKTRRSVPAGPESKHEYHHIPQRAASDFAKTTTQEPLKYRESHHLSQKFLFQDPLWTKSPLHAAPVFVPMSQLVAEREIRQQKRKAHAEHVPNVLHSSSSKEGMLSSSTERDTARPRRRGSKRLSSSAAEKEKAVARRTSRLITITDSMDNLARYSDVESVPTLPPVLQNPNDRHDWTQSDQNVPKSPKSPKGEKTLRGKKRSIFLSAPVGRLLESKSSPQLSSKLSSGGKVGPQLRRQKSGFFSFFLHRT
ncbi:hypothetical protein MMC25_007064 [Agyrium rufum]|nr:hypothetical protein [Agyrium rufum]